MAEHRAASLYCKPHTRHATRENLLIFNDLTRFAFCQPRVPVTKCTGKTVHLVKCVSFAPLFLAVSKMARRTEGQTCEYSELAPTIMNYINLATLDSMYEAENLAEALSRNGITARTHDEQDVQRFIFFTKPKAFSIVQVHDADYARAVNLIQDMQSTHEPVCRHIFSCPECGSLAVEYPQFTRKYFITPLLLEWASNFGLFEKKFYCRKCHALWPYQAGAKLPEIGHATGVQVAPPN